MNWNVDAGARIELSIRATRPTMRPGSLPTRQCASLGIQVSKSLFVYRVEGLILHCTPQGIPQRSMHLLALGSPDEFE
jgi:hypothetical protein